MSEHITEFTYAFPWFAAIVRESENRMHAQAHPTIPTTTDKKMICIDCDKPFTWTTGEQAFFADRNFTEPKRCKSCREKKRENREHNPRRQRR